MKGHTSLALAFLGGLVSGGLIAGTAAHSIALSRARQALDDFRAQQNSRGSSTAVIVAARDLPPGTVLSAADLRLRPISNHLMSVSLIGADSRKLVVGERLAVPVPAGSPLWWEFLVIPKSPAGGMGGAGFVAAKACEDALFARSEVKTTERTVADLRRRVLEERPP